MGVGDLEIGLIQLIMGVVVVNNKCQNLIWARGREYYNYMYVLINSKYEQGPGFSTF